MTILTFEADRPLSQIYSHERIHDQLTKPRENRMNCTECGDEIGTADTFYNRSFGVPVCGNCFEPARDAWREPAPYTCTPEAQASFDDVNNKKTIDRHPEYFWHYSLGTAYALTGPHSNDRRTAEQSIANRTAHPESVRRWREREKVQTVDTIDNVKWTNQPRLGDNYGQSPVDFTATRYRMTDSTREFFEREDVQAKMRELAKEGAVAFAVYCKEILTAKTAASDFWTGDKWIAPGNDLSMWAHRCRQVGDLYADSTGKPLGPRTAVDPGVDEGSKTVTVDQSGRVVSLKPGGKTWLDRYRDEVISVGPMKLPITITSRQQVVEMFGTGSAFADLCPAENETVESFRSRVAEKGDRERSVEHLRDEARQTDALIAENQNVKWQSVEIVAGAVSIGDGVPLTREELDTLGREMVAGFCRELDKVAAETLAVKVDPYTVPHSSEEAIEQQMAQHNQHTSHGAEYPIDDALGLLYMKRRDVRGFRADVIPKPKPKPEVVHPWRSEDVDYEL